MSNANGLLLIFVHTDWIYFFKKAIIFSRKKIWTSMKNNMCAFMVSQSAVVAQVSSVVSCTLNCIVNIYAWFWHFKNDEFVVCFWGFLGFFYPLVNIRTEISIVYAIFFKSLFFTIFFALHNQHISLCWTWTTQHLWLTDKSLFC